MVCNQFAAFSVYCYVITELARCNLKKYDVGTLWWSKSFYLFNRLDRNGSISLKSMVCNHFVAFSACCCSIITEFARYNEKKLTRVTCNGRSICSNPVE